MKKIHVEKEVIVFVTCQMQERQHVTPFHMVVGLHYSFTSWHLIPNSIARIYIKQICIKIFGT